MPDSVRVRFAPSPTGSLHVGGARSALFNYLFARHHRGTFILRIEDTDRNRYVEGAEQEIYDSLRWLGISWDEGPGAGGACGPYRQSERTAIYREHGDRLIASGHAYRCFCSPERIAALRAGQEKAGQPAGYDRKCRDLSRVEIERLLAGKAPFVVRLKIPFGRTVVFEDKIRGPVTCHSDVLDDIVLIKSDGYPTYHMANVVDDHLMGITHVMRGDEWIASTPRHVLLYEAFGWEPPHFAHLPIILAADGGKLSKRKGAASVMDYRRAGYLPEAMFKFLALLGWSPGKGDQREKMSAGDLIQAFSIEHVSPKAAVFDEKKLEWMNGTYLVERPPLSLVPEAAPQWKAKGWISADDDPRILPAIELLKVRSKRLTELVDSAGYFFTDPSGYEAKAAAKHFTPDTVKPMQELIALMERLPAFDAASLEKSYRDYAERSQCASGKLIHSTRLAVSGVSFGPGLFELMEALGRETVLRRMKTAISVIQKPKP
jgi:glutamyl-tRNA synthetase